MLVGIDMEGSDRDVNVQPTQRLPIAQLDWMKRTAANLKAMGGAVTDVEECAWKDADMRVRACTACAWSSFGGRVGVARVAGRGEVSCGRSVSLGRLLPLLLLLLLRGAAHFHVGSMRTPWR